jgi:hypothetical protein
MRCVVLLLVVLVLTTGCGGAAKHPASPLPHALALRWAQQAAAIAAADPCTAHRWATVLRTEVILAINKQQIPQRLLEPLTSKLNALAAHKACAPVQREAHDLAAWLRNPSS